MAILTRQVLADQANRLAKLHKKCFADSWEAKYFRELLSNKAVQALAQTEDDRDTGIALLQTIARETEILTFGIVPSHRAKGLGYKLLQACVDHVLAAGVRSMFLEVSGNNKAAQNLYFGFGFEHIGTRKEYYADRSDAMICRLSL